jgi:hypothetical protein
VHLVEILLPLRDNEGEPFGHELFVDVREELVERFGGLTAFTRSPAEGVWNAGGERNRDEIVVLEVMAETLDRQWWRAYRETLEQRFRQDEVVIRTSAVERL